MQLTINYHNYAFVFGDRTSYTPTFLGGSTKSIDRALKAGNADYAAAPLISIQPGTHMFP